MDIKVQGLMQIAYKSNYEGYGEAINENFLGANKVRIAKEKKTSAVGFRRCGIGFILRSDGLTPYALNNDLIAHMLLN